MKKLKNWDNKTWLSSRAYINSFISFLLKKKKLNKNSKILDIGCGRAKIFSSLSRKLKLLNKPIGIDTVFHKDIDRLINFKNTDAINFFKNNKIKFDPTKPAPPVTTIVFFILNTFIINFFLNNL